MTSIFDREAFNSSLFFPRADASPPGTAVDHFVEVAGTRLHVRCHPAPAARCTLLVFHGNGEVVADYDGAAALFARAGAALAVADYRGYGRSTGKPTLRNVIADSRTCAAAVPTPLVVMGRSLGAACAHELYARPVPGMIGVVLESGFFDLAGLIRRRGLVPPATYTADELATFEPAGKLRAGSLPLLVLHGANDTLVDPSDAIAAHAAAGGTDKRLVSIADRGHNDISSSHAYWDGLAAFIARATAAA